MCSLGLASVPVLHQDQSTIALGQELVLEPESQLVKQPLVMQPGLAPVQALSMPLPPPPQQPVALPQILAPFPDHRSHAPHCLADVGKKHRRPSPRPTLHTCRYAEERESTLKPIVESTHRKYIKCQSEKKDKNDSNAKTEQSAWCTTIAFPGSDPAILSASSHSASSKGSCPAPVDEHSLPPELRAKGLARALGSWVVAHVQRPALSARTIRHCQGSSRDAVSQPFAQYSHTLTLCATMCMACIRQSDSRSQTPCTAGSHHRASHQLPQLHPTWRP